MKTLRMDQVVAARMAANRAEISRLERENDALRRCWITAKSISGINKWEGYQFESDSILTPEFAAFARDFKKHLEASLPAGAKLVMFSRGHFDCSGFIRRGARYVYFSIPDVRYSPGEWLTNILIRTAQNETDYTGGRNNYTTIENFTLDVLALLKE